MEAYKIVTQFEEETIRSMMKLKLDEFIPDWLLNEFAKYKKLLNRVDGRLDAGTIAAALIEYGFNPDTNEFGDISHITGEEFVIEEDGTVLPTAEYVPEPEVEDEPLAEEEEPDQFEDEPEAVADDPAPTRYVHPNGTKVQFMYMGEMTNGVIEGHEIQEEEDVFYSIEVDGVVENPLMHEDDLVVEDNG